MLVSGIYWGFLLDKLSFFFFYFLTFFFFFSLLSSHFFFFLFHFFFIFFLLSSSIFPFFFSLRILSSSTLPFFPPLFSPFFRVSSSEYFRFVFHTGYLYLYRMTTHRCIRRGAVHTRQLRRKFRVSQSKVGPKSRIHTQSGLSLSLSPSVMSDDIWLG